MPSWSSLPARPRWAMRAVPMATRASQGCWRKTTRVRVSSGVRSVHQQTERGRRQRRQVGRGSGAGIGMVRGSFREGFPRQGLRGWPRTQGLVRNLLLMALWYQKDARMESFVWHLGFCGGHCLREHRGRVGDGVGIAIGIEPGPPSIPIPGNGSTESRPTPRWSLAPPPRWKMHRGRVGVATGALPLKIYGWLIALSQGPHSGLNPGLTAGLKEFL